MTKYRNLDAYVDQKNRWNSIFIDHGKENGKDWELNLIVFPLDDGDVDYLMKDIAVVAQKNMATQESISHQSALFNSTNMWHWRRYVALEKICGIGEAVICGIGEELSAL